MGQTQPPRSVFVSALNVMNAHKLQPVAQQSNVIFLAKINSCMKAMNTEYVIIDD